MAKSSIEINPLYVRIEKIAAERGYKNITELCKASGVPRATLTDLKYNRTNDLSSKNLTKLSAAFNLSTDYILGISVDAQIDKYTFRLAELEKALKTATAEEADKIAVEIDGLRESLKDMEFSQPFEGKAIPQAKKNNHPAETGRVVDQRTQRIFTFVDECSPEELSDLTKYIDFLETRRTAK